MEMKVYLLSVMIFFSSVFCLAQNEKKVLVFTKNGEGYVHDNIPSSIKGIQQLGKENNFLVDVSEDAGIFTEDNLKQYDALIFSNTNNGVFDTDEQRIAFIRYIEAGGGFVGIHSACATERDWPWFWKVVGGKFVRHAPFQEFTVKVIDTTHLSTSFFTTDWIREDECYYVNEINPDIHILMAADLNTIEDKGKDEYPGNTFGTTFPLVWCHEFDGGREWFTALGHSIEDYSEPVFLKHLLGGILWATENGKPDFSKAKSISIK